MDDQMLQETYRLAKENNKMLHSMRRNAFWGGLFKILFYLVFFVIVPFYLYMQYLAPVVDQALKTMQQVQGSGTQAQLQLQNFQQTLQEIQSKIPGFNSSTTTPQH
jgi:predicted PurR-regulated permease PerM